MSKYNKKKNNSSDENSSESEEEILKINKKTSNKNSEKSNNSSKTSSDGDSNDSDKRKKRDLKNMKNLKNQEKLYSEIKNMLGITNDDAPCFVFTSMKLNEIQNKLINVILPQIKEFHTYKMWRNINPENKFCDISILRNLFKYYGYKIVSAKTTTVTYAFKTYTIIKSAQK